MSISLWGQIEQPVQWQTSYEKIDGSIYQLTFTATIDKGWVLYSQHIEDGGPIPTSFVFEEGAHFQLEGETQESKENKKVKHDRIFDMKVAKYSKEAVFKQKVKVIDHSKPITGYLEFMTCDDEKCLPPTSKDFSFSIPGAPAIQTPETASVNARDEATTNTDIPAITQAEDATPEIEPISDEPTLLAPDTEVSIVSSGVNNNGPVSWSFSSEKITDQEYKLIITAQVQKGWYLYSQFIEEGGPIPTHFEFTPGDHYETIGKVEEIGKAKEGKDPLFDNMIVIKLISSEVQFVQKVKVNDPAKSIECLLEYMTCDDTQCLLKYIDFSFDLAGGIASIDQASTDGLASIDQSIPSLQETYATPLGNCGEEEVVRDASLLWTFILGFAGGLLALLTPCVFPMIPLTVSFFTKSSGDRKKGLRNALIYGVSIIVIYVAIGLLITGIFGAAALNQLSTNWIANVLFFLIFLFFAFSFFGFYEITLPSSWANKSDTMADKGGLIGIFFMAFTLALVSFSCTGPIIGSALVQSATDKLGPFVVMLGFSTALALPFTLFAAFPGWLNSLPKSGSWMNSVKVVLGFLELALALKFLSVADMTMHWNILPYEIFVGLWVLIFAATTLYLLGVFRFPHDSPVKKLSPTRLGFVALFLAATVYLVTGFKYDERTEAYDSRLLLSGLAPPAHYNIFLPEPEVDPAIKAKYPSFSKCANNLDCFKNNYEEGIAYAKEVNKPVLLDFTGYGCVNCRKTEEHIWIKDQVWEKISQDFVLISLYTDDRQALEEELVSKNTGQPLRNVGYLWSDFQTTNFEQSSQPLYVMMTPDQKVLAAPRGYKEGVKDYADFLECGLNTYQRVTQQGPVEAPKLGSN